MNRYCIMGSLLVFLLVVVGSSRARRDAEPVYAGRPVGEWLDCGYEQAAMALHETGPSAAPVIFSKLRREHPQYGLRAQYRKLWCKAPRAIRPALPAPKVASFDDARACSELLEIGPLVIPALAAGLKDVNPGVRLASAWALGCFRERGSNISSATPFLLRAREDPNTAVRQRVAAALGTLGKS